MSLNDFQASVNILTQFFQTTCREAGMITRVQLLEGPPPKFPNFGAISDDFRLWSRISPEWIYISNIWKKTWSTATPSKLDKKIFVELWSTNKKALEVHTDPPKWTFCGRLHFGPFNFLHALEIDQGLLAHAPTGRGSLSKKNPRI